MPSIGAFSVDHKLVTGSIRATRHGKPVVVLGALNPDDWLAVSTHALRLSLASAARLGYIALSRSGTSGATFGQGALRAASLALATPPPQAAMARWCSTAPSFRCGIGRHEERSAASFAPTRRGRALNTTCRGELRECRGWLGLCLLSGVGMPKCFGRRELAKASLGRWRHAPLAHPS